MTMTAVQDLGYCTQTSGVRTDVDTCDLCGRGARRAVRVRDENGHEFYAADRCARIMLGYDPFKTSAR